jgi:hypothetical protein
MLVLATLMMIIAMLSSTSDVKGVGDRHTGLREQNPHFLPVLTNRHDPSLNAPIFGVQMYGDSGPASDYYPFLKNSGSTWVRVPISWAGVEPEETIPPSYSWESADRALSAARIDSGSLSLIATIVTNPDWAATYANGPINIDDLDSFAAFVEAAVERYDGDGFEDAPGSPDVKHWEFYNEPDDVLEPRWGNAGDEYANMLSTVFPAVKSADPSAQVLIGGLAYDWFDYQGGRFNRQFLDDVLAFDGGVGGDYFDLMNFHIYPLFWNNWTDHESPGLLEKSVYIMDKLASYGYPDKGLVITEAGWHSNVPENPGAPAGDPEDQARFVVELFTQSMAADARIMIWWMLYDPGGTYPFDNGLVTKAPLPEIKPSFQAFQVVESELRSAHFQRILSVGETGTADMEAYEFIDNVHQRTVYVAWLDPIDTPDIKPLRIPTSWATVRDIYDNSYFVWDDLDGQVDGYVTIDVGGQPVFIEVSR